MPVGEVESNVSGSPVDKSALSPETAVGSMPGTSRASGEEDTTSPSADSPASPAPEEEDNTSTPEEGDMQNKKVDLETATDATAESASDEKQKSSAVSAPVVSSSKKSRPPYKYDPNKITLRFLFANRDGLTVTIECEPSDTVGEVKGALLSVWPEALNDCSGGDRLRLVCMGKGYLTPDSRTLQDCQIPVFKTHPTPINVSIAPDLNAASDGSGASASKKKHTGDGTSGGAGGSSGNRTSVSPADASAVSQGCACVIL